MLVLTPDFDGDAETQQTFADDAETQQTFADDADAKD